MSYRMFCNAGDVRGKRFAVQGVGNVGYFTAKFLMEWGALLMAIGDWLGSLG